MPIRSPATGLLLRLGIYLVLQAVILAVYTWAFFRAGTGHLGGIGFEELLRENRILEWIQIGLLAVISALCLGAFRVGQPLMHRLLAVLVPIAFFRELDAFLKDRFFDGAHTLLMTASFIVLLILLWRSRAQFLVEFPGFVTRPGFFMMVFGASLVVIYAQILGQRDIWQLVTFDHLLSYSKRLIEEGLELMGYVVIGCGVVEERFFSGRNADPAGSSAHPPGTARS